VGIVARSVTRMLVSTLVILLLLYAAVWIAIAQPFSGSAGIEISVTADPEALERHVRFLSIDAFPRDFESPDNLDRAADYIARSFGDAGATVTFQPYSAAGIAYRNVIARLGPDGPPRVVVGAHYDVFGKLPGADDNASGVAGLLELARMLAGCELEAPLELVAYSTEEPPFFWSSEMGSARHAASRRGQLTAMISLEMIGYYTAHQPAPSFPLRLLYPRTGDFILVAGRWADRPLIRTVKSAMRSAPGLEVQSYCGPTGVGTDLSDHRSYWEAGVPAVMITDTAFVRNPNYHTAGDTADTLDYAMMARTVDGVARAALALLR
jgi:hypothetical protein